MPFAACSKAHGMEMFNRLILLNETAASQKVRNNLMIRPVLCQDLKLQRRLLQARLVRASWVRILPMLQINYNNKHCVRFNQIEKPVVAYPEAVIECKFSFQLFDVWAEIRISSELRINNAFDFFVQLWGNISLPLLKALSFSNLKFRQGCIPRSAPPSVLFSNSAPAPCPARFRSFPCCPRTAQRKDIAALQIQGSWRWCVFARPLPH
jgi:hypothetical protein